MRHVLQFALWKYTVNKIERRCHLLGSRSKKVHSKARACLHLPADTWAFRMRPKHGALRSVDPGFTFCVFPKKKTSNVSGCSRLKVLRGG